MTILNRREAIAAGGGLAISAAASARAALKPTSPPPRRIVFICSSLGFLEQNFYPSSPDDLCSSRYLKQWQSLHNDFTALRAQLETIVATAEFNSTNLISSGASNLTVLSTVDGSTIAVNAENLSATGLGIEASDISTSSASVTALTAIETAIARVTERLANLGSSAKRIEIQNEFSSQLVDILKQGVGNLVDADLAEESAILQALQIKQQLGVQALAIANAGPQSILGLF